VSRDARFRTPRDRPPLVRAANALLRPFRRFVDVSSDHFVAIATRGLEAGAGERLEFRPALDALCHSLETEAELSTLGCLAAREDTTRLVRTQIRVGRLLDERPEILETELPRPIFVIGWPRSGTTILHALLAQNPAHRALLYYEGFDPAAPARFASSQGDFDPRKEELAKTLRALELMAPGYRAIHPMEPESVEECVTVLYHTFSTPQFAFQYHGPSFQRFIAAQGPLGPYTHYRKQLQMLHYFRRQGERWVLKDPTHFWALDAILELFPDASFVWIHRDPARTLASIASLTAHTRALFSDAFSAERVGSEVTREVWPQLLRRGLELRAQLPADRFVDVRYRDFMADPVGCVAGVYERLGLEATGALRARVAAFLRARPQGAEGVHHYSTAQFGIDAETERRRYADYIDRFQIPPEGD